MKALYLIVADDAACLLPAVLQGVQAKGHEVGGIHDANDAKDPTFFFQFVVVITIAQIAGIKWMGGRHDFGQRGSSESGLGLRTV